MSDDASLFRRDLHRTMAVSRGIKLGELADELGTSRQNVSQYFERGGGSERADRMDRAIDAISERRDLHPDRTVVAVSGLWPDGLPNVVALEENYWEELRMRDLMKAPGADL